MMTTQVLFQNRQPNRIATLEEYCASGGYEALSTALGKYTRPQVQQLAMVCNADEMEPGTFKDRVLIHTDPHQIIEGMIIVGYSVLAEKGIIFIRSSYENAARILEREMARAKEAGFLGKNILGSNFSMKITVHRSAGRYICGENTAQINAIEGKRANPIQPPPYPTQKGIWG
ncbi:MAG: NADH-quinone oxidoreductase subunit F, partial [Deltaproteobacteria bacterium]|nr:NADH-quinone oxidoreductase subunit F [Deltaproteobacteria bacterium]